MRRSFAIVAVLGLFNCTVPASAAAQANDPCLTPVTGGTPQFLLRDAKLIVRDVAGLAGSNGLPQTSVEVHGCAVLSAAGTPIGYQATYQAIIYTSDGHQLQAGTFSSPFLRADNPNGGAAHLPIADTIFLGYKIDHAKLAKSLTLYGVSIAPCTSIGTCASPATALGTLVAPACVLDGTMPPTPDCPAQ